jgi:antirestriction protein ArdC
MDAPNSSQAVNGRPVRPDPYQQVTDLIIEHLEKGVVPWRCPWNRETGRPRNFHTGKAYRGVNSILLGFRCAGSPWWMTYRQALERGGHVRKGERGAMVVKFGKFDLKDATEPPPPDVKRRQGTYLHSFVVFNATQIEGIAFPQAENGHAGDPKQRIQQAEEIAQQMPQRPIIHEGRGVRAVYRPKTDEVDMPAFSSFESAEAFHLTLFHELAHATGHSSRLNRPTLVKHDEFGGPVYSQEELVAEMAAAFVGMEAGIVRDQHEQSAAYLNSWLAVLKAKDHLKWIVQAASQAAAAADFILGRTQEEDSAGESTGNGPAPAAMEHHQPAC